MISIIIQVDKQLSTLPRLLQTIWNQQPHNLEHEVIIASALPSSLSEIERLNEIHDGNPILTHQLVKNAYGAEAHNECLALTKGSRFICLKEDNRLAPDFLRTIERHLLQNEHADIIYSDHLNMTLPNARCKAGYKSLADFSPELLRTTNTLGPSTLVRKEVWDTAAFRKNAIYEKWDFWIQATLHDFHFQHVPACLVSQEKSPPSFRERAEDGRGKAMLVINNHSFFHMHTLRWAMAHLRGDGWAGPWAFERIPNALEVTQMMHDHTRQRLPRAGFGGQKEMDFPDDTSITSSI